jgi:hypothetical protein
MGKHSQEKNTGMTEEERIKNPAKIIHEDVKAIEKDMKRRRRQNVSPYLLGSNK